MNSYNWHLFWNKYFSVFTTFTWFLCWNQIQRQSRMRRYACKYFFAQLQTESNLWWKATNLHSSTIIFEFLQMTFVLKKKFFSTFTTFTWFLCYNQIHWQSRKRRYACKYFLSETTRQFNDQERIIKMILKYHLSSVEWNKFWKKYAFSIFWYSLLSSILRAGSNSQTQEKDRKLDLIEPLIDQHTTVSNYLGKTQRTRKQWMHYE